MQSEANISGDSGLLEFIWRREEDPRRDRTVAYILCGIVLLCALEALRIGLFVLGGLPVVGILGIVPVRTLYFVDAVILLLAAAALGIFFSSYLIRLVQRGWPEALSIEGSVFIVQCDGRDKPALRVPVTQCGDIDVVQRGLLAGRGWHVRARNFEGGFFRYPFVVLARCESEKEADSVAGQVRSIYGRQGASE